MAAPRTLRFDRRMSDSEALMWRLEKDPALRSDFLNVTFLDKEPDFARFRRRIEDATIVIPRLRERVVASPGNLAPPEWAPDPSFDIDYHVRKIAVPTPGTDRELLDLAAAHLTDAFDRARPLWQFTIVTGLEGGRAAYLSKMHHTITDGVGGVRMSAMFIDLERDAPEPERPEAPAVPDEPPGGLSPLDVVGRAVSFVVGRQLAMGRRIAGDAVRAIIHPTELPRQALDVADVGRYLARQLLVREPALSPLWSGKRSLGRHFEILSADLDELKRAAKGLGGTINDAYVTVMAHAAGEYHRAKGADVEELRFSMPVSTREDKSAGGNAFTPIRFMIPVGKMDIDQRFGRVQERIRTERTQSTVSMDAFSGVLAAIPDSVLIRTARQQVQTVDFAASNVRGAPFDLYTAGAHIESNHPMGPLAGTAFNATVLSYRGNLDLGLNCDTAAIDDPGLLRDCIEDAFAQLLSLA